MLSALPIGKANFALALSPNDTSFTSGIYASRYSIFFFKNINCIDTLTNDIFVWSQAYIIHNYALNVVYWRINVIYMRNWVIWKIRSTYCKACFASVQHFGFFMNFLNFWHCLLIFVNDSKSLNSINLV